MLDRTIIIPTAPPLLVRRMYEQWHRGIGLGYPRGSQKRSEGYKFPCWICGVDGILGVDGFGAKGLVRPRNIMHEDCYETLTTEQRRVYAWRDRKHVLWQGQRRRSRADLDRESNREQEFKKWQESLQLPSRTTTVQRLPRRNS